MIKLIMLLAVVLLGGCANQVEIEDDDKRISDIIEYINLDKKDALEVINRVETLIPVEVQNAITKTTNRIELILGDREDFMSYMKGKPIEFTEYDYSGITGYGFENKTVVYSRVDEYVLIHELAHAYEYSFWYDGTKDNPSSKQEWVDAYNTEYISKLGTLNTMEFYAETFTMYFRNPKMLKRLCPIAFELLDSEFANLK